METLDIKAGATGATAEFVGETILNLRTGLLLNGLSEGNYTAEQLAAHSGCEVNIVADAARELVEAGLATERNPGIWRLTKDGWDRVHAFEPAEDLDS